MPGKKFSMEWILARHLVYKHGYPEAMEQSYALNRMHHFSQHFGRRVRQDHSYGTYRIGPGKYDEFGDMP